MLAKLCLCPALNLSLSLPPYEIEEWGSCPEQVLQLPMLPFETSQSMRAMELSSLLHVR